MGHGKKSVSPKESSGNSNTTVDSSNSTVEASTSYEKSSNKIEKEVEKRDILSHVILIIIIIITIVTHPESIVDGKVTGKVVWYAGWITAISTGLGVIPFYFINEPSKYYMGLSNAVAGGMMIAASVSLAYEGTIHTPSEGLETIDNINNMLEPIMRVLFGLLLGIAFIVSTKKILDNFEHLKLGDIEGVNAQKMVLIVFVMTLHSLTEGVGIGVSFGGKTGSQLGQFISLSLAVHNIPEGLAVALVLTSRKVSKIKSCLWAIFTSLPQPLMALPAFYFVEHFSPMLPVGLGFAAGAMAYVAVFELLVEATIDTSVMVTAIVSSIAFCGMIFIQSCVKSISVI